MTDTATIDRARVERLAAYDRIIQKARARLRAIAQLEEASPTRYVAKADELALAGLIELEHALEDLNA